MNLGSLSAACRAPGVMITGAGVLPRPLNLPIIMATVLIAAVAVIGANLIVDTLSAVIDPRIRLT